MTKRRVKLDSKRLTSKPRVSHAKRKPAKARREEPKARAEKAEPKAEPKGKSMAARLAAMAAASAELEDVPEPVKGKAPGGGVAWQDYDDGEEAPAPAKAEKPNGALLAPVKAKAAPIDEGVQVVAKSASKFSIEDLAVLKAAIKVKGGGTVIDGINLDELKYDAEGLVPVIAQDRRTGAVLQLGWGSRDTIEDCLRNRRMVYWSRDHGKAITREGHPQRLVSMRADCDKDSLLAIVDHDGPACHLDKGTCWTDGRAQPMASFLGDLDRDIAAAAKDPKAGEAGKLLAEPLAALKAFVEDANTVTRALQGKAGAGSVEAKAADTLYHLLVACRTKGVGLEKLVTELYARHLAAEVKRMEAA